MFSFRCLIYVHNSKKIKQLINKHLQIVTWESELVEYIDVPSNSPNMGVDNTNGSNGKPIIGNLNNNGNNCLILACLGNTNLDVIRYLIEEKSIDVI